MGKRLIRLLKERGDFLLFNGLIIFVISLTFSFFNEVLKTIDLLLLIILPLIAGNVFYLMISGWGESKPPKINLEQNGNAIIMKKDFNKRNFLIFVILTNILSGILSGIFFRDDFLKSLLFFFAPLFIMDVIYLWLFKWRKKLRTEPTS